jgi:hypothetical protein
MFLLHTALVDMAPTTAHQMFSRKGALTSIGRTRMLNQAPTAVVCISLFKFNPDFPIKHFVSHQIPSIYVIKHAAVCFVGNDFLIFYSNSVVLQ